MTFALVGNQNSGKTTLFNQLTGSKQHVGNFPGVTVEKKQGTIRKSKEASVVDLPGIYSLSPYTAEEVVTRDFLIAEKPDGVINIVDATNIERNLYLSLQVMELEIPMVIALNMMDAVQQSGSYIDIEKLKEELGVPIVPISASKNEGIDYLITKAMEVATKKIRPKKLDFCEGSVHRAIHSVAHLIEDHAQAVGLPRRFAATRLVEGDVQIECALKLSDNEKDILNHIVTEMEQESQTDREAALADMRYAFIEAATENAVFKSSESKEHLRSIKIDNILTHKYFAIPIFLLIMALIFWLTFGVIGLWLSDVLNTGIDTFTAFVDQRLTAFGLSATIHSLIIDGVFAGVGSVLTFLPLIIVLFFFLSLLEDSGYMARVAFVMDKLLRKIGLSGRSFVPMLIGFGCSVPAIMATRTLPSARDRKMTILLTPFMSCSAKVPVYGIFAAAFFAENQALVVISLYILGMIVAIVTGLLMKKTVFKGNPVPFVLELPAYRMPSARTTLLHVWERAKDFIVRAFTIIFLASLVIWLLQSFDFRFNMVTDSSKSMLAAIGSVMAPIFKPLGFGTWQASTALITGFTAKEAVISTFQVLLGSNMTLHDLFTPLSALAFLCFTLLYMPCAAAFAATKREMGSYRQAVLVVGYQTGIAWVVAFIVYNVGKLIVGG
ncbi:MAG: ferrous iron transport protein B [Eubacteriaceae bacterium]|nr:ferrous iron transport protein B [Eubacteriaceae bacterium]